MTYRGHIHHGTIVLDEPIPMPDGSPVTVDLIPAPSTNSPAVPLADSLQHLIGKATNLPADGSLQHDHYIYGSPKS